jgi:multidrug transporter EmrE-like cation transporter
MKKYFNFVFILLSILFQSLSGILGKYAALSINLSNPISFLSNLFYLLSLGCMIFQALVWQQALKHYDLSLAYPFQSLTMFVILIFSYLFFHESISAFNILGICIIFMGIFFLNQELHGSTHE